MIPMAMARKIHIARKRSKMPRFLNADCFSWGFVETMALSFSISGVGLVVELGGLRLSCCIDAIVNGKKKQVINDYKRYKWWYEDFYQRRIIWIIDAVYWSMSLAHADWTSRLGWVKSGVLLLWAIWLAIVLIYGTAIVENLDDILVFVVHRIYISRFHGLSTKHLWKLA